MASTAAYNDKSAPVYSPSAMGTSASPSHAVPYAVQIDEAPYAQPATILLVQQPLHHVQIPIAPASQASGDWEIDICDCCAMPAHCCMAFFFPCVNGAYAAHWIGWSGALACIFFFAMYTGNYVFAALSYNNNPSDSGYYSYNDGSSFDLWEVASFACGLLFFLGVFLLRRSVREFYRIQGSCITDCCCSFWCSCCVMSQMSAHTERAKGKRSASTATLPAYRAV